MKRAFLFLLMVFTFSACETNSVHNTETNPSPTAIPITAAPSEKEATVFLAEAPDYLSAWDYETAYKLCAAALSDYYKAAWNGSEMDVDAYIGNENLKLYTQQKIQSYYNVTLKKNLNDNRVTAVDVGARKVELVGGDDGFFYLQLNARVKMGIGSFAEPTEFLVKNVNGRMVIADWYTNAKDSYDSTRRGGNQKINNSDIWHNEEWVKKFGI